jgi:uncharacterized protein (TIGR03084 family)
MTDLDAIRNDLVDQQESLDQMVAAIPDDQWRLATPSPGWNVSDQIGHLTFFDGTAAVAIIDTEAFRASVTELMNGAVAEGYDEYTLGDARAMSPVEVLDAWREAREALREAALTLEDDDRVEWYGPSMGARSFLTARLMETWAHGTDIADALGTHLAATDRLRHIAQLGYLTRAWSYTVRGEEPPVETVRLELTSPSGTIWTWGPDDADELVRGSAEEFCLVVTQRRHVDDTSLEASGAARHWLLRAQAFAGGPTSGPGPRGDDDAR